MSRVGEDSVRSTKIATSIVEMCRRFRHKWENMEDDRGSRKPSTTRADFNLEPIRQGE